MDENVAAEAYDDERAEDAETPDDDARELGRRQLSRGRIARLGDRIAGGAARPGEQQIARSPFVLVLLGAAAALALLAFIFYYIINREAESRRLQEAMAALEQRKYAEAERLFIKFLELYPETASADTARLNLHKSRVEKYIMTTTPDVAKGKQELDDLLRIGKDLAGFADERETIRRYADRLTFAGARVAEVTQQQEPLDVSRLAMEILARFSPESGIPKDREEVLVRHQRIAEAAIAKRVAFDDAVRQIREFLQAGRTVDALAARTALLDRYAVLRDDKDVAALLDEILKKEQELTVVSSVGTDAATDDAQAARPSLSLTLRTRAVTDQLSQGRLVFAVGLDSVYGLDADTGEPRWKRAIGTDPAFAPQLVNGSQPELLVHSSNTNELQLLSQETGQLLWRQSVGSRPSGAPLIQQPQIYVTTEQGELWQLSAANGRATARVRFPQKVIGPPVLTRDGKSLLIPGDQMMVYTLSVSSLACTAVSYIDHRAGSVQSPLLAAGDLYLLCDNHQAEQCRLRMLALDPAAGRLSVRATEMVDGQVRDPGLLYGSNLFIPSSPQRITAFHVSADPDQPPLTRIGANQLEDGEQTRMFLLAGPGNQLWLGGRALRKFRTKTNAVILDEGRTAEGIHTQPIQFADEGVFLTSREKTLSSVFFTRADREQMQGLWRTVVGTRVVAIGAAAGSQSLLAACDFGQVFRVPLADVARGGFALEAVSEFRLPDKLASAVNGLTLADGRLATWCGAPEPAVWTFSPTGQLERRWTMPDAPELKPVTIQAGVVFGLPGRLHLTGLAGGKTAEDYRAAQAAGQQLGWKSLTSLTDTQVLAIDSDNKLIRVEYRENPRPQLAELSVTQLEQPVEVSPTAAQGLLFVATATGRLILMQSATLEVLAETDLGGVPSQSPFVSGDRVFVEVARRELKSFVIDNTLRQTGLLPLEGHPLSGAPVPVPGGFVVARADGLVTRLNADGLPSENSLQLGQAISQGPVQINEQLLVVAIDGSLYVLPTELSQ